MNIIIGDFLLRCIEPQDIEQLYQYKNNMDVASQLGGFSMGYSKADLNDWVEYHRKCNNELVLSLICIDNNKCIGHVGLYNIDFRIRSAEFAILIGDATFWGKGVGKLSTKTMLLYGFRELNLNRISLSVLSTNTKAIALYTSVGFLQEGVLKMAQYKNGTYVDVILMAMLRDNFERIEKTQLP